MVVVMVINVVCVLMCNLFVVVDTGVKSNIASSGLIVVSAVVSFIVVIPTLVFVVIVVVI